MARRQSRLPRLRPRRRRPPRRRPPPRHRRRPRRRPRRRRPPRRTPTPPRPPRPPRPRPPPRRARPHRPPPPTPPPPQPPGTILFEEHFESNAFASRGWYDNPSMTITTSQHIPGSTAALEVHFAAGATMPTWGGAARHLFTATPTLYVSYWVKYSSNWVGSGKPYHPHEFQAMSDQDGDYDGPSIAWLVAYIEHNYQNGGKPHLALQDSKAINTSYGTPPINLVGVTENRAVNGCNGVVETNLRGVDCFNMPPWYNNKQLETAQPYFQPSPGPGYKGDWHHVEAYF